MKKLILICWLLGATNLFAQSVATVLFTTNKVVANHNGVERALSRGSSLNAGDAIITTAGGAANIKYLNGTLVNIGESSNYKILAYSPKHNDVQIKAELSVGKVEFTTPGKMKETLKTPVIALAILGTRAKVYVPAKDEMYLMVYEGQVLAGNRFVNPGESIQVTPQGIFNVPFPNVGNIGAHLNAGNQTQTQTQTSAAANLGLVSTSQVTSSATTQSVAASQAASMGSTFATLTLACSNT